MKLSIVALLVLGWAFHSFMNMVSESAHAQAAVQIQMIEKQATCNNTSSL